MALVSSNVLQIRRVMQRETGADGKVSFFENLQYKTKDVVVSILGVSLGTWSAWQSIPRADLVYVDEDGNEL